MVLGSAQQAIDSAPFAFFLMGMALGGGLMLVGFVTGYRSAIRRADPLAGACRCWLLKGGARGPHDPPELHREDCPVRRRYGLRLLQSQVLLEHDRRAHRMPTHPYDHELEEAG